jgi:hypothetical protein
MIPPVGIGLGIYAVGHAIFSNLLSRGQEVRFPVNTPLQVRQGEFVLRRKWN